MRETMVEPDERAHGGSPPPTRRSRFEEGLAYLLTFSEGLLELVPDGIGVLDDRLRVRSANRAFAEVFGFDSAEGIRGVPLRSEALFRIPVPDRPGVTVGLLLRNLLATGGDDTLYFERLEVTNPTDGSVRRWSMRVCMWDTEDPKYRRVLLWVHPWRDRNEPRLPDDARSAHREDRIARLAFDRHLFERLAVCVVDSAFRVQLASPRFEEMLGRSFDPDAPGDRHVFAVFPMLRHDSLRVLLDVARQGGTTGSVQLALSDQGDARRHVEVEIQVLTPREERAPELLLLLHEVHGMATSSATDSQRTGPSVPDSLDAIASNLAGWPPPLNERVLLVEGDSWTRMLWADALRQAEVTEVALCETPRDVWTRHDPAAFGAIIVGLDGDSAEVRTLCHRLARDAAKVPILGLSDCDAEGAREIVGDARLAGILAGPGKEDRLRELIPVIFRRGDRPGGPSGPAEPERPTPATDPPTQATDVGESAAPPAPEDVSGAGGGPVAGAEPGSGDSGAATFDLVILGAAEPDVQQLRLLYRAERLHIRFVYDPDPHAFGLPLARNLGIPAASDAESYRAESKPDAVVLARPGLEEHLTGLGLENCPRVTRDEIELFLADPDAFLAAEDFSREAPPNDEPPGPPEPFSPADGFQETDLGEPESAPEPDAPEPDAETVAEDPFEAAYEAVREPAPESAPTPESATVPEAPRPAVPPTENRGADVARETTPAAPRRAPLASGDVSREVAQLLDALDLLLDFDRLAERVLDLAIETTRGATGSLMLLNEDHSELRIAAAVGLPPRILEKTRQRPGEGIGGRVIQEGEALLLRGTVRDERTGSGAERTELRSSVCAPVLSEGQIIGVLSVNSDPFREPFDNNDLIEVARLGRSVGAALDRSRQLRLMRGRSFELSVRAEIEELASGSDDLLSRLRRVAARVAQILSLDTCEIWLYDAESRSLALRAVSGLSVVSMDAVTVAVGSGHVGWVAKNLRPLVLRSQSDDPDDADSPRLTNVGVPIRYQTELVGVLTVECTSNVTLDEERVALIASIASVVGEKIGRSRAFQDSERKVTMLSALSELGLAFSSATERTSLAKLVTFTASTLIESEVATIRLLREDADPSKGDPALYERLASHGATVSDEGPLADLEDRIARDVALHSRPCTKADLSSPEVDRLLQRSNVSSFLGIPCWSGDSLLGVLSVFRVVDRDGKSREYGAPELEIAERLGDYAGAAALRFTSGAGPGEE